MKRYQRYEAVWKEGFRLKRFARPWVCGAEEGYVRDLDAYNRILDSLK